MTSAGYTIFDTAVGRCGIAWGADGAVTAVRLPDESDEATARYLARDGAGESAPPQAITRVIAAITDLVSGANLDDDLAWVALDLRGLTEFRVSVYGAARRIPPGSTRTYGEIATEIGLPGSARAVGRALGENPFPPVVPCHRVTAAHGRTGGFSAGGGVTTKMRLLATERAVLGLW